MQKDKYRLFLIGVLTFTFLIGAVLYGYMAFSLEKVNFSNLMPLVISLILVVFMVFFITRRYRDVKAGMPLEDERSRKVVTLAAAKAFYVTLYWLLALSMFEPFFAKVLFGQQKLDASQTTGGAITGMSILFFGFWIYYDRKGKLI